MFIASKLFSLYTRPSDHTHLFSSRFFYSNDNNCQKDKITTSISLIFKSFLFILNLYQKNKDIQF